MKIGRVFLFRVIHATPDTIEFLKTVKIHSEQPYNLVSMNEVGWVLGDQWFKPEFITILKSSLHQEALLPNSCFYTCTNVSTY